MATFNANNQLGARAFLEQRVAPDVVLLQEAKAAHWPTAHFPVASLGGRTRESATGIDTNNLEIAPLPPDVLGRSSPRGTLTAATVRTPGGVEFTVASVYAQINGGLAYPTAFAILDDLEVLLTSQRSERLVLGGDFNAWDQFDKAARDRRARAIWQDLWSRLQRLGLINLLHATRGTRPRLEWCRCGLGAECWHVPTVRRVRIGQPAHCDYLFASRWFAERLIGCDVVSINDAELRVASDHAPVTASFAVA